MKKKVAAGVAISALLVYLSVRGIDFTAVAEGFRKADWGYALGACLGIVLMQVFRAFRWGFILRPLVRIDFFPLFSISNVGFLAITALPARLGELVRPYLIAKRSPLAMSAALGTIFVERVTDCLTVMLIGAAVLLLIPLPVWLVRAASLFFGMTLLLAILLFWLILRPEKTQRIITPLTGRLPERYREGVRRIIGHFLEGFRIISAPGPLLAVVGLSLVIWLTNVCIIHLMLRSFGWQLPAAVPFVVMLILIVGIAIPTAPGFIGNWHYFCILALSLFGIPKVEALPFAIVYHFLNIGVIVLLGLAFLPANRFSLTAMRREATVEALRPPP
ncbi:MAG: flippase-like domain-containing protein [Syntrophaceae bacterium]|nr:flippase-like domain-containing protein [Syntrophaceae bacterium]